MAPTPRPSGVVTNGCRARKLPVGSALVIRQVSARKKTLTRCAWKQKLGADHSHRRLRLSSPNLGLQFLADLISPLRRSR